ncbi:cystatin domain-containing protein [Vibrio sagamiensis]|uniref:2-oxoglutarate dehydrogenase n=1 Tax=Vibrio sagamiensis NBRC 104589 TaxID=1219064 RepID=A0A511QK90_9VIBR|nr:cystatin domain-containing protein [Vibrio sagamiensis]PNQ68340.1 2-oxoglutarate dehydrogenase [Vibrio agarivorans]GEM76882.1 2-oxoglutarate dehydrogenase [Vibrio sagamiensis NBRC 104589]
MKKNLLASLVCIVALVGCDKKQDVMIETPTQATSEAQQKIEVAAEEAMAETPQQWEESHLTKDLTKPNPICGDKNLAGGWSKQDLSPEAQQAMDFVLNETNMTPEFSEILDVRTQIVSGTNYAIEYELKNGAILHVVVYRPLQGELQIIQPAELGPLCP